MGNPIITTINVEDVPYKIKGSLYDGLGNNTDGGITQAAITSELNSINETIDNIEHNNTLEYEESIVILDNLDSSVVEITSSYVNAKNLKSNGIDVATLEDISTFASIDDINDKQDKIDNIGYEELNFQTPTIEFRDDNDNYVGEVSPEAIAAKKFLIKTSPEDIGVDISGIVGGTTVAKTLGFSDIVHVIGYGQSHMSGTNSGLPVSTTQNRANLKRFAGGVRPYDTFDLDSSRRVNIERQSGVEPTYLEMSDNKSACLTQKSINYIAASVDSLVSLTEQRVKYEKNQNNTYSPNPSVINASTSGHADGETPLTGFCEGFLNAIEKSYGSNFGFEMLATCCAYGSADFLSLCPLDRDGIIHNEKEIDGTNFNYFDVLMMTVKEAKELADAENKSYSVDVVIYMESNTIAVNRSGNTVNLTVQQKAYRIAQLFTLINQRVKEITKQSNDIIFLCDQSKTFMAQREAIRILCIDKEFALTEAEQNTLETLTNNDIEPYDMNKIYLVIGSNNYEVGTDHVHHPAYAQKLEGATIGEIYAKILSRNNFEPLYPIKFKVIDNDIYVKYHVPVSPIIIDMNAVNGAHTCPNWCTERGEMYGFSIFNKNTSTYEPNFITAAEVTEGDTIKLTCESSPVGKVLEYCYRPIDNSSTGLPTNCEFGNVRDSQGDIAKITINDTEHPLHNWSIGFSKDII